jgi:hypothetical protein
MLTKGGKSAYEGTFPNYCISSCNLSYFKIQKLRYDEAVLHGQPMIVTAAGEHNLQNGRFDLTLLVAPLVNLDRIFEHIPLIGGILEALDTIPLSAKGTLDNIHIDPLASSAIGYELEEMMKKTVRRPVNLVYGGQRSDDRGQKTEVRRQRTEVKK